MFALFSYLHADKGLIPIGLPNISIYEPAQQVIIGWDNGKEILILSINAYADTDCKVLEILPLPSEPKVKEGNINAFNEVQNLINAHSPKTRMIPPGFKGRAAEVEIIFHKKIGPHNITCVKSTNYDEFILWVSKFLGKEKIYEKELPKDLPTIIKDYINDSIFYFVFDIVNLIKENQTIIPLVYEFNSPYLFFPLKITKLAKGHTKINLYLITKYPPWIQEIYPFTFAKYRILGGGEEIIFEIKNDEIAKIDSTLLTILPTSAYFTALKFVGNANALFSDLKIKKFCKIIKY